MRAILFLLLITVSSNAFAKKDGWNAENDLTIVGNWQVTSTHDATTDARTITLMLKSDNDILGNNPDTLNPMPLTLSVICSTDKKIKKKPVLSILYPNILFPAATQNIHFVTDKKPPQPLTGTISKITSGNTTGEMLTLDEQTTQSLLSSMAGSEQLTIKLDFDKSGNFDSRFTTDKTAQALKPVKKYCMDIK